MIPFVFIIKNLNGFGRSSITLSLLLIHSPFLCRHRTTLSCNSFSPYNATIFWRPICTAFALYYFTLFYDVKQHNEEQSVDIFHTLQHEITSHTIPVNTEIKTLLEQPAFEDISYQLIFMMPSGQTYIHRHVRSNEPAFATVTFPIILSL